MSIFIFLKLFGCIALLIYGMKNMSESLQKMAGPQLRAALGGMASNRFFGVLTGAGVTMTVQSSTATTVMTVSFVNAGLLTLAQAISVIMGANIGTTLTAWIMSAGFSFKISDLVWPAFLIGILLIYSKKGRYSGDFFFGLSFMIFALNMLKQTGMEMDLANNKDVVDFFASFDPNSFLTIIIFLLCGSVMTFCVQSSAAVMAITMVLCASGVLPIYLGIALVLGENIGTTITANLAALTANVQSRRAAMAHFLFNVFGVLWVLCVFRPFVDMACWFVGLDLNGSKQIDPVMLSFALASFHTAFNLINTSILIWFIPQFEKVVCLIIRERAQDKQKSEEDDFSLRFIAGGILKTPELSIAQANREINFFASRIAEMVEMVSELTVEKDVEKFNAIVERIRKYETFCDKAEDAIGEYLSNVSAADLSESSTATVRQLMSQLSVIEGIGDCCYNIARSLNHHYSAKEKFSKAQKDALQDAVNYVNNAMANMRAAIVHEEKRDIDITEIRNIRSGMLGLLDACNTMNIVEIKEKKSTYGAASNFKDCINQFNSICYYAFHTVELQVRHKIALHEDEILALDASTKIDAEKVKVTKAEAKAAKEAIAAAPAGSPAKGVVTEVPPKG